MANTKKMKENTGIKPAVAKDTDIIDMALAKEEAEALAKDDIIAEIEKDFNGGYDFQKTVEEIRFYQEQSGVSFIEMGRRLLRIKAHEEHGMFIHALNELQLSRTTAFYFMSAARKFSNVQATEHLSVEKMRILSVLDDDEVQKLKDDNEIFGMTFDDIDKMTTRELRSKLREARDKQKNDRESLETVIKQKEEKNNELERQLRGLEPLSKEKIAQERCKEYIKKFSAKIASIQMDFVSLRQMIDEIQSIEGINLVIIEEFQELFNVPFQLLEGSREAFYNVYDNAHVYSRDEQLDAGVIKSYGKDLKDERRRY